MNTDGTLDAGFNAEAGPGDGGIQAVLTLPDGTLLVGGTFTTFGATSHKYLVQLKGQTLSSPPATPTSLIGQALGGSSIRITWNDVADEYSWQLERRPSGTLDWQLIADLEWDTTTFTDTGLTTGVTYEYRLRATNGAGNSLFSGTTALRTLKPYEQWKLDEGFPLTTPDDDDSDADGIGLLAEYALGLDPGEPQLEGAPVSQIVGGVLAISYLNLRSDLSYVVETSTDLQNWTSTVVDQGSGIFPIAWVPIDGLSQRYLRLRISVR